MEIALAHDQHCDQHLQEIIEDMKTMESPKIKAVWMDQYHIYSALEGCHRLRASQILNLKPEIIELNYNDVAELYLNDPILDLDFDNPGSTVGWLIDNCLNRVILTFDED